MQVKTVECEKLNNKIFIDAELIVSTPLQVRLEIYKRQPEGMKQSSRFENENLLLVS